jgi:hypothetical protein
MQCMQRVHLRKHQQPFFSWKQLPELGPDTPLGKALRALTSWESAADTIEGFIQLLRNLCEHLAGHHGVSKEAIRSVRRLPAATVEVVALRENVSQ